MVATMSRSLLVAVVWMLSGCASVSTMGLARTLNKGGAQGWVGPSGGGVVALGASPGSQATTIGYPLVEGGGRIGITDHFELGGRIGFSGIGIEGKVAFLRPPTMDSGVNVSINPGFTFAGFGGGDLFTGTLTFHLPVLIGIDFNGHELVLGPRIIDQVVFGALTAAPINVLYAGGSVGFAVKVSPTFRMIPELAIGVPAFITGPNGSGGATSALGGGGLIFQAGLGFVFGGPNQYDNVEPRPLTAPPPPPPLVPAPPPPPPNAL